jgi:predicted transglutaminase-like cysteine proteinase
MFSRVVHGFAVLLMLLSFVLLDRAFGQSLAATGGDEVATFASRFAAVDELPLRQMQDLSPFRIQPPDTAAPAQHSLQMPDPEEPFGLRVEPVTTGQVLDKWNGLVADIRAENEILARCRKDASHCPAAAQKFLDVVAIGRAYDGRARIGIINRAINLAIRPTSDLVQWGIADRWSAPLETLASGRGDCEDYAIAKYVALRETGLAGNDVRLIIVRDLASGEDHAVVAARVEAKWIMLDNRRLTLLEDDAMPHVLPLFAFDDGGVKRFAPLIAEAHRAPLPADIGSATPSALFDFGRILSANQS